ncbi:hypothetical protein HN011_000506, partial [Eciton burchellii]
KQRSILAREKRVCFNCLRSGLRSGHFTPKCSSKSRCVHCRRAHHSLLHSEKGRTTKAIAKQAPGTGGSETQSVANTSSVAESAIVAHVQTVQAKVPRANYGALTTAWIDLHTAK